MPIKVPNNLPAIETLTKENVFVMTDTRAMTQDIRPLQILILNLMPTKVETETQLTRLLGNTPLQVELELLQTSTHKATNISEEHMIAFYKTFSQIKHKNYDGMIITGAPVELMDFEEVDYWDELCEIMEWSKRHVHSTFHICWGAQAGLYYHYGIKKHTLPKKLSGVFKHHLDYKNGMLFRGFDDEFYVPHSRNTTIYREDIEAVPGLKIISSSEEAGVYAVKSENDRQIFITGHSEYDWDTLLKEYIRDKNAGINPEIPCNYFPNDDDTQEPVVKWRSCANLLYSNWLNYFVYQTTTYDIEAIQDSTLDAMIHDNNGIDLKVAKFGGTSLADAEQFKKCAAIIDAEPERRYVVVSAPGKRRDNDVKVTDLLIQCADKNKVEAEEVLPKLMSRYKVIVRGLGVDVDIDAEFEKITEALGKPAKRDYIISRGEYLNAKIMSALTGMDFVDAEGNIFLDENGIYDEEKTKAALGKVLKEHDRAVIPGFYGTMPDGSIKTFSRGGSDITGAIVAAVTGADIYENWTDVSGFYMADPRVVDNPLAVPVITYKELRELSYMGAAVLHEDTIFPVVKMEIPINIRNTNKPEASGTMITAKPNIHEDRIISGIAGRKNFTVIGLYKNHLANEKGFIRRLAGIIEDYDMTIEHIPTGIDTMSVVLDNRMLNGKLEDLVEEIENQLKPDRLDVVEDMALIATVGAGMAERKGTSAKLFAALAEAGVNIRMIDQGSSEMNIIVGVENKDFDTSIRAIYEAFVK